MERRVRFLDRSGSIRIGEWREGHIQMGGLSFELDEVLVLPPVVPSKIVCIGRNYEDHAKEFDNDIPERPILFLKTPNCIAGHEDVIMLPKGKERVDYEAELAVVIGKECKDVSPDDALDYVMGYTCFNDVSNRDDQMIETNWVRGKAFDNSAPFGPVIASPELVPDDARIQLRQNGEIRQDSDISNMAFSIPELIEEITKYVTLKRGDMIATGTPAGVGPIEEGDKIEVEIEGIGTLVNYFER